MIDQEQNNLFREFDNTISVLVVLAMIVLSVTLCFVCMYLLFDNNWLILFPLQFVNGYFMRMTYEKMKMLSTAEQNNNCG